LNIDVPETEPHKQRDQTMDSKSYSIGILFVTAIVLFVAQFMPVPTATAGTAIRERDYSLVTAAAVAGGEALYIADNRTGFIAVFMWDANRRMVDVRDVKPISEAFRQ
jgi:hypothetical protein